MSFGGTHKFAKTWVFVEELKPSLSSNGVFTIHLLCLWTQMGFLQYICYAYGQLGIFVTFYYFFLSFSNPINMTKIPSLYFYNTLLNLFKLIKLLIRLTRRRKTKKIWEAMTIDNSSSIILLIVALHLYLMCWLIINYMRNSFFF